MYGFLFPSPQRASTRESTLNGDPYDRGRAVLNDPSLLSRRGFRLRSRVRIWLGALMIGAVVFFIALAIQWSIYDRYLHENGIRVVGSGIAATISIALVVTLGMASRRRHKQEIKRLETIALLNHHIRNALQAIVSCSGSSDSTNIIRRSVERIEWALGEVVPSLSQRDTGQSAEDV